MKQKGFSTVEVLIGMTIGLFLVGSALGVLLNVQSAGRIVREQNQLQENGRFAMEILKQDIRNADNWGCVQSTTNVLSVLGSGYVNYLQKSIDGTDSLFDTLIVRRNDTAGFPVGSAMTIPTDPIVASTNFQAGDVVVINDCYSGDIFQITNDPTTGNIEHIVGGGSPGNDTNSLSKAYGTNATLYAIQEHVYSVKVIDSENWLVSTSKGTDTRLIPGVAGFAVTYGIDQDNDGVPNTYVSSGSVPDMKKVIAVRFELLLKSKPNTALTNQTYLFDNQTITATDNAIYRVFTSTVTIRNRQQ